MPLGPLWLGLTLLGALQTWAQHPTLVLVPAPVLLRVPVQLDFQEEQFQGRWYVLAETENSSKQREPISYYVNTFELLKNHSFRVSSFLKRNNSCDHWIRNLVQQDKPGQFTLDSFRGLGLKRYEMRVVKTDYQRFALVLHTSILATKEGVRASLYARDSQLDPELRGKFLNFIKSLGLTDRHVAFITHDKASTNCLD
ncbi:neutrophil gelatinase-associated lipocalin-like isoform X2 [Elephas maximus indicus]|uniref:neutrophil gelatinase-associated lipocalin-like isoform X2 n=1 Tax=Elephas maximus indicus TaxID=99487 RepID=UPI002116D6B5|nr:neutrophil gelatinase-associated lipocalin-like isoform X2 [Elephas maximus indicus]